jgi:hypothetical protein
MVASRRFKAVVNFRAANWLCAPSTKRVVG